MGLYEVINEQLDKANKMMKKGDELVVQVFQIGDRNTIHNPHIFKDNDDVFVTDMNGKIYNLKKYGEIKVGISTQKRLFFDLKKYKNER